MSWGLYGKIQKPSKLSRVNENLNTASEDWNFKTGTKIDKISDIKASWVHTRWSMNQRYRRNSVRDVLKCYCNRVRLGMMRITKFSKTWLLDANYYSKAYSHVINWWNLTRDARLEELIYHAYWTILGRCEAIEWSYAITSLGNCVIHVWNGPWSKL